MFEVARAEGPGLGVVQRSAPLVINERQGRKEGKKKGKNERGM